MNKFLILEFRDASLIKSHRGTRDKFSDPNGRGLKVDRGECTQFVEPITTQQVSNMLHVLFGERPKPKNRYTFYSRIDYLFEKAKESYIKIDNIKDKYGNYQSELFQTHKPFWNSTQTSSFMNWNRVYKLLGNDLYTFFTSVIKDVFNQTPETITFITLSDLLKESTDPRVIEMFDALKKRNKKCLEECIKGKSAGINKTVSTMLTIIRGVDKQINFNGSIIVPVDDEDIEKIRSAKGCATLLDGGVVFIKGLKNNVNVDGYTKMCDISMEEIMIKTKKEIDEN
jgi:hypothetical protein